MYGTLGYIDNGRRPAMRDANFIGSNGHFARRDMYGARRPENSGGEVAMGTTVTSDSAALLQRRCLYLEENDKRRVAEIADLRARLVEAHVETVTGTVQRTTLQTNADEVDPQAPTIEVPESTVVTLQYPMKRIRTGPVTQVWMRRREVDPYIASIAYSWILLFEETEGKPDHVFVSQFR